VMWRDQAQPGKSALVVNRFASFPSRAWGPIIPLGKVFLRQAPLMNPSSTAIVTITSTRNTAKSAWASALRTHYRQTARAEGAERGCSYCETGHHPGMVPAAHCPQV
jgi:hypothetical protein